MSGGIVQLVATGAQDAWLSGKPEVSFFRSNYRRYTHYAHSVERQIIQGQPTPGGVSTIRLEKKGDLVNYMYLSARDTNGAAVTNLDWSQVIDKVELLIGGQVIDTQDFEYSTDIEPLTGAQTFSQRYLNNQAAPTNQKSVFYPFKFFFCKDWSVSLPLVALQFHDVELRITWSSNLGNTVSFGATTNPVLSGPPVAVGNVASSTQQSLPAGSNLSANIVFNSFTGPLYTGSLIVAPTANTQTQLAVVRSLNLNTTLLQGSNVLVNFANSVGISNIFASSNATATIVPANSVVNVYAPVTTGVVPLVSPIAVGATSAQLAFSSFSSPLGVGSAPQIGQYVAGLPVTGPVAVTAVTGTTVTVSFPAQLAPTQVQAGTVVSFFQGTATSTVKYSDLQILCWANFVFLDDSERSFFAKTTQDLLITQVNRVTILTNPVQELALAHPVKFLAFPSINYTTLYANGANSAVATNYVLKTQINGVDVGEFRHLPAWTEASHYFHTPFGYIHNGAVANVAIISYCLDTSKLQPTGTLNFSRLDTFRLVTSPSLTNGIKDLTNQSITSPYLYAVNYNVLRIQNGLGGLLYSN